jgi:hypothetical protein
MVCGPLGPACDGGPPPLPGASGAACRFFPPPPPRQPGPFTPPFFFSPLSPRSRSRSRAERVASGPCCLPAWPSAGPAARPAAISGQLSACLSVSQAARPSVDLLGRFPGCPAHRTARQPVDLPSWTPPVCPSLRRAGAGWLTDRSAQFRGKKKKNGEGRGEKDRDRAASPLRAKAGQDRSATSVQPSRLSRTWVHDGRLVRQCVSVRAHVDAPLVVRWFSAVWIYRVLPPTDAREGVA